MKKLARLVDTVLELSELPDSLPYHPIFGDYTSHVEPGDLAFPRLPGLGLLLYENLKGSHNFSSRVRIVGSSSDRGCYTSQGVETLAGIYRMLRSRLLIILLSS